MAIVVVIVIRGRGRKLFPIKQTNKQKQGVSRILWLACGLGAARTTCEILLKDKTREGGENVVRA